MIGHKWKQVLKQFEITGLVLMIIDAIKFNTQVIAVVQDGIFWPRKAQSWCWDIETISLQLGYAHIDHEETLHGVLQNPNNSWTCMDSS